jgi:hypothetical protein
MRNRLKRLERLAKQGGVIIKTTDGRMEKFSEMAPLALFSLEVDEERAAYTGVPAEEPTTPQQREALRLRQLLKDATPESRADYEEQNREFFEMVEVLRCSREEIGTS